MESITVDEILKQLHDVENELIIKPRKEVALFLGADKDQIDSITGKTIFIISGYYRKGLPPFVRFSSILEKNTFIMMDDPSTF
tara:strand:- start:400 stop:648 length:249 start_codon:yes stop_codon:yes gene_type:complete